MLLTVPRPATAVEAAPDPVSGPSVAVLKAHLGDQTATTIEAADLGDRSAPRNRLVEFRRLRRRSGRGRFGSWRRCRSSAPPGGKGTPAWQVLAGDPVTIGIRLYGSPGSRYSSASAWLAGRRSRSRDDAPRRRASRPPGQARSWMRRRANQPTISLFAQLRSQIGAKVASVQCAPPVDGPKTSLYGRFSAHQHWGWWLARVAEAGGDAVNG